MTAIRTSASVAVRLFLATGGLLLLAGPASAGAVYTGLLSTDDGSLVAEGLWQTGGTTTLWWQVSENPDGSWRYHYIFTAPTRDMNHFILETSANVANTDILQYAVAKGFGPGAEPLTVPIEIKTHLASSPSNPLMPEDMYGIKFDEASGTTVEIILDIWRMPVWGDFYAKDGGNPITAAWNAGFTTADFDPSLPPSDHFYGNTHILVPDSLVPEPATLALFGLGAWLLRRRGV